MSSYIKTVFNTCCSYSSPCVVWMWWSSLWIPPDSQVTGNSPKVSWARATARLRGDRMTFGCSGPRGRFSRNRKPSRSIAPPRALCSSGLNSWFPVHLWSVSSSSSTGPETSGAAGLGSSSKQKNTQVSVPQKPKKRRGTSSFTRRRFFLLSVPGSTDRTREEEHAASFPNNQPEKQHQHITSMAAHCCVCSLCVFTVCVHCVCSLCVFTVCFHCVCSLCVFTVCVVSCCVHTDGSTACSVCVHVCGTNKGIGIGIWMK